MIKTNPKWVIVVLAISLCIVLGVPAKFFQWIILFLLAVCAIYILIHFITRKSAINIASDSLRIGKEDARVGLSEGASSYKAYSKDMQGEEGLITFYRIDNSQTEYRTAHLEKGNFTGWVGDWRQIDKIPQDARPISDVM